MSNETRRVQKRSPGGRRIHIHSAVETRSRSSWERAFDRARHRLAANVLVLIQLLARV
ncbi:MAG TPA: hypothetical protein VGQ62_22450 [Chloroflexota bacterium]|nr:hypothetical protein [Chloroflexota bacterium]